MAPPNSIMATIKARRQANGAIRYTAIVRKRLDKVIVHREAKTFMHRSAALSWARHREVEVENQAHLQGPEMTSSGSLPWCLCNRRAKAHHSGFRRTCPSRGRLGLVRQAHSKRYGDVEPNDIFRQAGRPGARCVRAESSPACQPSLAISHATRCWQLVRSSPENQRRRCIRTSSDTPLPKHGWQAAHPSARSPLVLACRNLQLPQPSRHPRGSLSVKNRDRLNPAEGVQLPRPVQARHLLRDTSAD